MSHMNHKQFFDAIRGHKDINLTEQNVLGFEKHLAYMKGAKTPVNDGAYALATSYWETGGTMTPVLEAYWLSENWRRNNLRYYPWYGRGLIQTTWKRNYEAVGELLGLGRTFFTNNPNKLLEWEHALPALFKAMEVGLYTGKSLNDYIDDEDESDAEDYKEYVNARRIVNGTDKRHKIAGIALAMENALRSSGYEKDLADMPKPPPSNNAPGDDAWGPGAPPRKLTPIPDPGPKPKVQPITPRRSIWRWLWETFIVGRPDA